MKRLLFFLFLLPLLSFGQYSQKEIVQLLSNNDSKTWQLDEVSHSIIKGQGEDSLIYPSYTFSKTGKVTIQADVNGEWKVQEFTYDLLNEGPFDWWIQFNNRKYKLSIIQTSEFHWVKLRFASRDNLKDPMLNITLKHLLK